MNPTHNRTAWTAAILGALIAGNLRAQVLYSGSGSVTASVTPFPVGVDSSSSFSSSYPVFPDDGSAAGSTSGGTTFTANGITAVGFANASYSAVSAQGGLNTTIHSAFNYPATSPNTSFGNFLNYGATSSASVNSRITVNDLVFTGPAAAVPVSFNFLFTSILAAAAAGTTSSDYSYTAFSISMSYSGGSISPFTGDTSGYVQQFSNGSLYTSGFLTGYSSGTIPVQSGIFAAPTGVPITLSLSLNAQSNGSGNYDTTGSADAYAAATLPTSGPVFNLPSGYTANSAQLGVVNNSNVPEPQEYAVVAGLSLAGFGLWRRTRQSVR